MRKIYDVSQLSEKQQSKLDTLYDRLKNKRNVNQVPPSAGIFNTEVYGKDQEFKVGRNEMMIRNQGAYIVFGNDRPSSKASGTGGKGAMGTNTIDLVVGRMASTRKGKGARPGAHVDNSFSADAARVYISQLTKIDKHFGLTHGSKHPAVAEQPRSAVAIKADNVRIIGRESIKIVTGKQRGVTGFMLGGEPNSLGSPMHQPAPVIELIAGNSTAERFEFGGFSPGPPITKISHLQPAVMGDNLKACLREIMHIIEMLWERTFILHAWQIMADILMGLEPFKFLYSYWSPFYYAHMFEAGQQFMAFWSVRVQMLFWELNYLYPFGFKHIVSSNIKLT
jgi:hypothetical protein